MHPVNSGRVYQLEQAMINAAERMKALGKRAQTSEAPSSIFGSALSLADSVESDEQFRIGFYPIISANEPELAMGLASCLCYLLEQFNDTRVYRCFAKIDEADGEAEITSSDYQFSIDDWELEGLADNIQVCGALELGEAEFTLRLIMDASLLDADEEDVFAFCYPTLPALVSGLPQVALAIISRLGVSGDEQAIIDFPPLQDDSAQLRKLLADVFEWNLDVYLRLWGVEWAEDDIVRQLDDVAGRGELTSEVFPGWCLGMMAGQIMQTGLEDCGDVIVPRLSQYFSGQRTALGAAAAARGLSQLGYGGRAVELLESYLLPNAPASCWSSMIDIHLATGQLAEAIDICQRALELGLQHPALYWRYSQLLINAEAQEWPVEALLFVDPEEYEDEAQIAAEIASALKHHLSHAADNLSALQLALAYMIDVNDEDIWIYFKQLARQDEEGEYAADIVERLLDLEDHDEAYKILERATDANAYAHVFLAQLALADEDTVLASDTIAACRRRLAEIDVELEMELQRLELKARLANFEESFAEIKLALGGDRRVSEGQVELLEEAVEIAPTLVDLYVILSRCYRSWADGDSAIEVLRDAEEQAGAHPQIDLSRAQILWARNEKDGAISSLNKGLAAFPGDVHLLVQMANFLIANEQLQDARQYILRAETIAPSHRAIWQVRRLVAQKMSELT